MYTAVLGPTRVTALIYSRLSGRGHTHCTQPSRSARTASMRMARLAGT